MIPLRSCETRTDDTAVCLAMFEHTEFVEHGADRGLMANGAAWYGPAVRWGLSISLSGDLGRPEAGSGRGARRG